MTKEIKKLYKFLKLSIYANEDEILSNQKMQIKTVRAKALKKNIDCSKQVEEIVLATNTILDYVKKEGCPQQKNPPKEISVSDILSGLFACVMLIILCFVCMYTM